MLNPITTFISSIPARLGNLGRRLVGQRRTPPVSPGRLKTLVFPEGANVIHDDDPERPGKKVVLCIDGTSNDELDLNTTNVRILYELLDGPEWYRIYVRGIGHEVPPSHDSSLFASVTSLLDAKDGPIDAARILDRLQERARGGAATYRQLVGADAERRRDEILRALNEAFRDGDTLFVFGFSRGAALARMVAAEMNRLSLAGESWPSIHFMGLWDTVAAFANMYQFQGVKIALPADLDEARRENTILHKELYDFRINDNVRRVVHLVAMDEVRNAFGAMPLLDPRPSKPVDDSFEEIWMPGTHSDVGGGVPGRGLANVALRTMVQRANADELVPLGLDLDLTGFDGDELAPIHPTDRLPGPLETLVSALELGVRTATANHVRTRIIRSWLRGPRSVAEHHPVDDAASPLPLVVHPAVLARQARDRGLFASDGAVLDELTKNRAVVATGL